MQQKQENGLLSIAINILIPVFILNKLSLKLGPPLALGLALAFPLVYGSVDLIRRRKMNFISLLGLINIAITGGLAVAGLYGIWFSIKEAAFPGLIGIFVMASAYSKSPFIKTLLLNPSFVNIDTIESRLEENRAHLQFAQLLKTCTIALSLSFFVSAILNFVIAQRIFIPIDSTLNQEAQSVVLNQQIAKMTYTGMIVLVLPSFAFLFGLLWRLLKGIEKLTGLSQEHIFLDKKLQPPASEKS
jgi:hypothetical protein